MAVYASPLADVADKDIPRRLGARLGLARLHANPLADEDGISSLEAAPEKSARGYIPYSNQRLLLAYRRLLQRPGAPHPRVHPALRATRRHGRRKPPARSRDRLHPAARRRPRTTCRALMAPDAMTIPANAATAMDRAPGADRPGVLHRCRRAAHALHRAHAQHRMAAGRHDARRGALPEPDPRRGLALRLRAAPAAGQGLVCNNVLHNRSAFTDDPAPGLGRLVYRARYSDRIAEVAAR